MHVLRIEHPVPNFDTWKNAFDGDPIGRKQMGVRRYLVYRPTDDPNYALVDLNSTPRRKRRPVYPPCVPSGAGFRALS